MDRFDTTYPPKYDAWERILLVDANARVGSFPTPCVGPWQAETDTDKSEPFVHFLQTHQLWLPATFEPYQKGDGGTWRHPSGKWLRNDFVAVPLQWSYTELSARVSDDVDLSTVKEDHALAVVQFCAPAIPTRSHINARMRKRHEHDLDALPTYVDWPSLHVPFDVDVHTHAHLLQQHILQALPVQSRRSRPLKTSLSEATWQLIQDSTIWPSKQANCCTLRKHEIFGKLSVVPFQK